jgi:hypothetical protein
MEVRSPLKWRASFAALVIFTGLSSVAQAYTVASWQIVPNAGTCMCLQWYGSNVGEIRTRTPMQSPTHRQFIQSGQSYEDNNGGVITIDKQDHDQYGNCVPNGQEACQAACEKWGATSKRVATAHNEKRDQICEAEPNDSTAKLGRVVGSKCGSASRYNEVFFRSIYSSIVWKNCSDKAAVEPNTECRPNATADPNSDPRIIKIAATTNSNQTHQYVCNRYGNWEKTWYDCYYDCWTVQKHVGAGIDLNCGKFKAVSDVTPYLAFSKSCNAVPTIPPPYNIESLWKPSSTLVIDNEGHHSVPPDHGAEDTDPAKPALRCQNDGPTCVGPADGFYGKDRTSEHTFYCQYCLGRKGVDSDKTRCQDTCDYLMKLELHLPEEDRRNLSCNSIQMGGCMRCPPWEKPHAHNITTPKCKNTAPACTCRHGAGVDADGCLTGWKPPL